MRRFVVKTVVGIWLCVASAVWAQDASAPVVETTLDQTEVIPGQPVLLRITVLVPTWLSKPVEFPSFEAPDLLVKLFEKSTNPTSRTIDGETWSGVSRVYRLSPLVAGPVQIPAQNVDILWAEPGKTDPIKTTVQVDAITLSGIRPAGTEDLDPFIAATALTLTQEISTDARTLKPGDSITRTLTADISEASPFGLPQLSTTTPIPGVALYPSEPVITEETQDQWLSGSRVESLSVVAESGGEGAIPAVEITWYNITSGAVETAQVDGFDITVDAPVARDGPRISAERLAVIIAAGLGICLILVLLYRYVLPRARAMTDRRRAARLASEAWAYEQLKQAIKTADYSTFQRAFVQWEKRVPNSSALANPDLSKATMRLGNCLYGPKVKDSSTAWIDLERAVADTRQVAKQQSIGGSTFLRTPINPT